MERPLVVDLDGTLVKTDLLIESSLLLLKARPLTALCRIPLWFSQGRAKLKREVAKRVELSVGLLPYRKALLDYLQKECERGRMLVLASAIDERLGIFELLYEWAYDGRHFP